MFIEKQKKSVIFGRDTPLNIYFKTIKTLPFINFYALLKKKKTIARSLNKYKILFVDHIIVYEKYIDRIFCVSNIFRHK